MVHAILPLLWAGGGCERPRQASLRSLFSTLAALALLLRRRLEASLTICRKPGCIDGCLQFLPPTVALLLDQVALACHNPLLYPGIVLCQKKRKAVSADSQICMTSCRYIYTLTTGPLNAEDAFKLPAASNRKAGSCMSKDYKHHMPEGTFVSDGCWK